MMKEELKMKTLIVVEKFRDNEVLPYEKIECENLFLTTGKNELFALMTGASANHFNNADSRIGIGNDKTTAPAIGQTDLQGASKTYKAMEATFPTTPTSGSVQFKSIFGTADANYEWGEFVIKNNTSSICINRSTNSGVGWGTKNSGETWTVTATLSLS